jgi:hypothetical protein
MSGGTPASVQRMNALASQLRSSMPEGELGPTNYGPSSAARAGRTKPPSGSGIRRGGHSGATNLLSSDAAQLASDYEVLRHRYEDVVKENETLKAEQKRRMESYMRRETSYQSEVNDLKAEVERQRKTGPSESSRMNGLRQKHAQVMNVIGSMQSREQLSLQEQEKDLLRAFRARLWDVQFELESERSKKDDGALEWIEKTKTLGKELDWSREEALRLDRMNQFLTKENERMKTQLRSQEDDREFIVRQMLTLKKENSRLKAAAAAERDEGNDDFGGSSLGVNSRSQSAGVRRGHSSSEASLGRPSTAGAIRGAETIDGMASSERVKELMLQQAESEERYREVVARLKRLLDVERRNLRAVRGAHAKDLQSRTELEALLRACVDDVRKEIAAERGRASPPGGGTPTASARLAGVEDLGPK